MEIELEWGEQGIRTGSEIDLFVIVDVLSFSTCVDIALSRGATILPFRFKDQRAKAFAAQRQALLAGERSSAGFSLSPASLQMLPANTSLVLPSPNGATLSLLTSPVPAVCACLRNAAAVAAWIQKNAFARVRLIPAGERWPDGSLRPALEDWLGAGAIAAGLGGKLRAEARAAADASTTAQLPELIFDSVSGRELVERGFADDVALALELNVSSVVPLFDGESYADAAKKI